MQVAEAPVLLQLFGLGLVLLHLGLRHLEPALEVAGRLVRLPHALVALLQVLLERLDGAVPPVDLLLRAGAQGADLVVQVLQLRVASLQLGAAARQLGRRLVQGRLDL